jgi:hypothetical protein
MKELIKFTFDFFAHVIPGLFVIFSISLLFITDVSLDVLLKMTGKIDKITATVIVIIAYVVGFAINPFGRFLYRFVGFKLWRNKIVNNVDLFISDKFALIRHHSPANFNYVETWNIYCAMAHNLAFASLCLCLVSVIKIIQQQTDPVNWIVMALISLILFFIFIQRAVTFYHWASHDLNATISSLNLDTKQSE